VSAHWVSCRECWLDLRPYIDTSPYVIFGQASIQVRIECFSVDDVIAPVQSLVDVRVQV
jgi:hypothetical protein